MAPFLEMKEILEGNKGGTASRDYTSLAAYRAARDFFTIKASLNGQADCVLARKAAWTFETLTRMSKEHGSADYGLFHRKEKRMKKWIKEMFLANWTPWEKGLLIADVLLLGILMGWITSPLKSGLRLFSNNSWEIGKEYKDEKEEEEE